MSSNLIRSTCNLGDRCYAVGMKLTDEDLKYLEEEITDLVLDCIFNKIDILKASLRDHVCAYVKANLITELEHLKVKE